MSLPVRASNEDNISCFSGRPVVEAVEKIKQQSQADEDDQ